jgi:hypothetical protein
LKKQLEYCIEGFIVRDVNWNRLKIKSPQYVALSHLSLKDKKGINGKYMLSIIRTNEGDEFLSYFPEHSTLYKLLKVFGVFFIVLKNRANMSTLQQECRKF